MKKLIVLCLILLLAAGAALAEEAPVNPFDFESRTVLLNNGIEMPILGIGTYTLTNSQASDTVYWALTTGFRLIDTAHAYGNERGVGEGIVRSGVPREEIFVTTKLWPTDYENCMENIDKALDRLGLDYIDLMLLHQPTDDYVGAYLTMEEAVRQGKLRAIGLSNFSPEQFEEIMAVATIPPAVHQVETHPYFQETSMMKYLNQYGTVLEAWFPLGGRGHTQELLNDPVIVEIAEAHERSAAQIILRWHLQSGHIAIPGSNNPDHIQEDFELFDFELTDDEMAAMRALDSGIPYSPSTITEEDIAAWGEMLGITGGEEAE